MRVVSLQLNSHFSLDTVESFSVEFLVLWHDCFKINLDGDSYILSAAKM